MTLDCTSGFVPTRLTSVCLFHRVSLPRLKRFYSPTLRLFTGGKILIDPKMPFDSRHGLLHRRLHRALLGRESHCRKRFSRSLAPRLDFVFAPFRFHFSNKSLSIKNECLWMRIDLMKKCWANAPASVVDYDNKSDISKLLEFIIEEENFFRPSAHPLVPKVKIFFSPLSSRDVDHAPP